MNNFRSACQATLIYDGECPFCANYIRLLRIREQLELKLVNARNGGEVVALVVSKGYDLDEGFVLHIADRYYHGDECMHILALLSTPSNWFNRMNKTIFSRPRLARLLYPVLRTVRNTTLKLMGRKPLNPRPPTQRLGDRR